MTGDLVAQLKGASFSYYGAPETLHAVDLDVHAGECVVLMGASGSGKTTIVRVLNGLAGGYYRGSVSGDVFLGGLSARDMEAWRRAELVGSVFQDPTAQFFSSQLAGEVAFGCENIGYPAEEVVRRTDAAIGRLGLDRLRTIAVDELSSGQKQRVAIASSLAPAPRLVVMDEPSSNLDEDAAQELGAVLMELKRQGYALVVAEHRISYLMECADRFCYMKAGRMRAVLSRDDVFAMDGSERVAMGVRSPAFVPRPSLKPAPLAAGLAREGERSAFGEAFGARLEAASLEVDGLAVSRGGNLLFSDVRFAVEPGQIMALTGKNGVGKTSLAQVAVGLGRPDEGCVRVGGRKLSRRELRRRVWYSPNDVSMEFFSSRVDEEVLLFSDQDDAARHYADHVLGRLGLAELGDRHPSSLSGGQKQRLSIACGLASRRSVLILDEPTSGLDALSMRRLADALRCAAEEGAAVVVITHDNEFMRECCTHAFARELGVFHVKHPGARVPPVRASASRSPAPPAPVASRAAPPTGWSPACAHAPSAISRLPRVCTPLCPPPLQRRRIALFPDVSRETPRASAPSIARPVPAFRFLVRMFHVKHSSRSRTACPGRVRARRAARDGEKASNSEEGARLRRPRRAVAEARLPSTRRYAEEGFPARPEPGAKLPNSMVSCHGEPLPPSSRPRRGLGGRHPAEKSSGEGATSGPVAVGLTAGLRKERTTWPFPPVKTQKARRRGYATRFRG